MGGGGGLERGKKKGKEKGYLVFKLRKVSFSCHVILASAELGGGKNDN